MPPCDDEGAGEPVVLIHAGVGDRAAGGTEAAPDALERDPSLLRRVLAPVLAAAGETDVVDFKRRAEEVVGLVADGRLETVAGAGHLAPRRDRSRVAVGQPPAGVGREVERGLGAPRALGVPERLRRALQHRRADLP